MDKFLVKCSRMNQFRPITNEEIIVKTVHEQMARL